MISEMNLWNLDIIFDNLDIIFDNLDLIFDNLDIIMLKLMDHELGVTMGEIRRALSLEFVKAHSLCLLSRLCHLGEGAQAAADRRGRAAREEEERRRVQAAHYWAM